MNDSRTYLFVVVAGAMLLIAAARGAELPQAARLRQASMTTGFSASSLPVLHRESGASSANSAASLHKSVCSTCSSLTPRADGDLESGSDHFALTVSPDGSTADFHDLAVAARSHSLAKPLEQKMSATVLEKAGRAYIQSQLGPQIALGKDEELVALRADYRVEGIQELSTGKITRSVAANRIVFGRRINGVPVVGNGSTVVVTFANDGSVESFHYDWPQYTVSRTQSVVAPSAILGRIQQAVSARTGVAPAIVVAVPDAKAEVGVVDLGAGTQLQSMECGYYDAGAQAGLASIQPGCVYHAVHTDSTGMRAGFAGAVPGGEQFQADAHWAETKLVK